LLGVVVDRGQCLQLWQRHSPLFFERLLQHPDLEHLLELPVLFLKLLEAPGVGHLHPSILAPPPIKGLLTDVGLLTDLFRGFPSVGLAQYLYHLFCCMSLSIM